MTLDEVADYFGVNRSTVLRWERGAMPEKADPNEIAERYQVRVAWLMHGDGPVRGAAPSEPPPAHREQKSDPRLAITQVNDVLSAAHVSELERAAAWQRLQTVQGQELTAEWLRGWVDGYRVGRGTTGGQVRPITPPPKRSHR